MKITNNPDIKANNGLNPVTNAKVATPQNITPCKIKKNLTPRNFSFQNESK